MLKPIRPLSTLGGLLLICALFSGCNSRSSTATPLPPPGPCDGTTITALTPNAGVARVGSVYSSTLYDPSISSGNTTINPQKIKVLVSKDGTPAVGCPVSWQPQDGLGGGWVYPDSPISGSDGTVSAWWIAGTDATQTVIASVAHTNGAPATTTITGQATPHSTRSNSIHIWYSTPKWNKIKVTVTPRSWAPTTYYEAINWAAAYTGIQSNQALFSVWSLNGVDPTILYQAPNATCGNFGGEGTGLHCSIPVTPTINLGYVFEVDTAINVAGSEDYTVLFTDPVAGTTTEIASMRYPATPQQSGGMSFVEDWAQSSSSCLTSIERTADFSAVYQTPDNPGVWVPVTRASGDAVFTPNHNEVCMNYQLSVLDGQFHASSGGMAAGQPLNLPQGPRSIPLQIPQPSSP